MAQFSLFQPKDYFNSTLYTGTGASNAITGVGFQPDATWIKNRSATDTHQLADSVSGATKYNYPAESYSQSTNVESVKSFDVDGFTVGTQNTINTNTEAFVSWNWKGGTTSGIDATGADITPSAYSFSQTAGISIIKYTGNGVSGAKIAHGLGAIPQFIVVFNTQTAENKVTYHAGIGADKYFLLNSNAAEADSPNWNDATPTSVYFEVNNNDAANKSGDVIIAYCFAEKTGFSKFGGYLGNGITDGPFIHTGFTPSFFIQKEVPNTGNWHMGFNAVTPSRNAVTGLLYADTTGVSSDTGWVDFNANGVKIRTAGGGQNQNNTAYVYMAFAESPIVSSNDIPGVAR